MSAPRGVSAPRGAWSGGVPGPGGVCSWGCLLPGGAWSGGLVPGGLVWGGGIPACTEADPPWTESQMPVKTLPWPNFVAAGNDDTIQIYNGHTNCE